jgi:prephenate dehydrogenase
VHGLGHHGRGARAARRRGAQAAGDRLKLAVLGVGLIGGSIGLAAREHLEDAEIVGFGRSPGRLERARELGAIDRAAGSLEEAVEGATACFACGPVGTLAGQVTAALAAAPDDCVVTDVGSTKRRLVEAIDDQRFIGGHPIAGAETSGVEHARADLFQGAVWYLTPRERSSGLLYERLHRIVVALGARPVAIDAESHDRLLATVSHLPHVLANVLVSQAARVLAREDEALPRVGPSFRDATRVAGASSDVWTDIYLGNREAIADEIDETARRLREVAESLRAGDPEAVRDWNDRAANDRRRLLEADLAGGAVHELRLTVPNRPGIVAQVALALGKANVNIVDLALAPAPDMRTGAMTLWIAGDDEAARATELIEALGFPVVEP